MAKNDEKKSMKKKKAADKDTNAGYEKPTNRNNPIPR